MNWTTKNPNVTNMRSTQLKRRKSRQSTDTFTNMDFDVIGNTNEVSREVYMVCLLGEPLNPKEKRRGIA